MRGGSTRRASRRASATRRHSTATSTIPPSSAQSSVASPTAWAPDCRRHGWEARTIAIKVRFADFTTISRSQTLPEPTAVGQRIGEAALELFGAVERTLPVRLVGVRAEKLRPSGPAGLTLWDDDAEWRRVEGALDDATARFGRGAVTRATLLGGARGGGTLPSHPKPPRVD